MKLTPAQQDKTEGQEPDQPLDLMKADFNDIVFQHRNKAYGAYRLRRDYHWNKLKGFLLSVALLLLLIYFDHITHLFDGNSNDIEEKNVVVELTNVESEKQVLPPPPPPPPPPSKKAPKPKGKVPKQPKPKEPDTPFDPNQPPKLNDQPTVDDQTATDTVTNNQKGPTDSEAIKDEPAEKPAPPPSGPVVKLAEQMPSYPGGEAAMLRFIFQHLRYPDPAREAGIVGKVYITFIVEKDGRITKVEIKQDIGGGCGNEAARIIRMMPKWVPGRTDNQNVRVLMTLPFEFSLLD